MSVYILGSEHTGVVKFFQFWCVFEIFQNKILEKRNSMHYDVVVWHMHLKYIEKQIEIIVLKRASIQFSSVQSLSHVPLSVTPWTAARQGSLSITNSRSLLKLMSIELVMPSNHLILCRPLLLLPSVFPSIRVFWNEWALHIRWPKCWSFSFSISPSKEYSGLISLGWTCWISLKSKGLSRVFSNSIVQKHQFFSLVSGIKFCRSHWH